MTPPLLRDAAAFLVHEAEVGLRGGIALGGERLKMAQRRGEVATLIGTPSAAPILLRSWLPSITSTVPNPARAPNPS
jgi:hypothetical protein